METPTAGPDRCREGRSNEPSYLAATKSPFRPISSRRDSDPAGQQRCTRAQRDRRDDTMTWSSGAWSRTDRPALPADQPDVPVTGGAGPRRVDTCDVLARELDMSVRDDRELRWVRAREGVASSQLPVHRLVPANSWLKIHRYIIDPIAIAPT